MFSIGQVAEQVGISTATLRAWERRYAIVEPRRTRGDYRIYSRDDLKTLRAMKQLIDAGWSSALAAEEVLRGGAGPAPSFDDAAPTAHKIPEQFVAAVAALDSSRLQSIVDHMFSLGSFETATMRYLFPALRALGDAWAAGTVTVAGEHLASHAVGRRLAAAYDAAASSGGARRVLMGLPPGCRHELGLLAFAVAARRRGLDVTYLGADVPVTDWVAAVGNPAPAAVVLALTCKTDIAPATDMVSALRASHREIVIGAGGPEADSAPPGVIRLNDDLSVAVEMLAEAVAGPRATIRT